MSRAQVATGACGCDSLRGMIWIEDGRVRAPDLPAVWLVATGAAPAGLAGRSRLRRETAARILARQLDRPEGALPIDHLPGGRPVLPGCEGLHLSLATRAGVVAVGLAGEPVGVDVEEIQQDAPVPLALLHPLEQAELERASAADRTTVFAQVWAAKEAYVKALGTGFARPPESFAVSLLASGRFRVTDPSQPTAAQGWTRLLNGGGRVALAAAVIVLGEA